MFSELNKLDISLHFAHATCPLSEWTNITQRVYDNNKNLQRLSRLIFLPLQKQTGIIKYTHATLSATKSD